MFFLLTVALDIWSAGIILLCFLTRRFPFFNSNDDTEALVEIAAMFGRRKMERCAVIHSKSWSSILLSEWFLTDVLTSNQIVLSSPTLLLSKHHLIQLFTISSNLLILLLSSRIHLIDQVLFHLQLNQMQLGTKEVKFV